MCIRFPIEVDLKKFVVYFKDTKNRDFELKYEIGKSLPRHSPLLPIIKPRFNLGFNIIYKIYELVHHGCIPGPLIGDEFFELCNPTKKKDIRSILSVHEELHFVDQCYKPKEWV